MFALFDFLYGEIREKIPEAFRNQTSVPVALNGCNVTLWNWAGCLIHNRLCRSWTR
jgi:hypothetical protein